MQQLQLFDVLRRVTAFIGTITNVKGNCYFHLRGKRLILLQVTPKRRLTSTTHHQATFQCYSNSYSQRLEILQIS